MLKQRIFLLEYLFAIYFLLQTFYPDSFTFVPTLVIFAALSYLKYNLEGFRIVYFLILLIQLLIFPFNSIYIRLLLSLLTFAGILYFPVYKYPNPTGPYRVGYKIQKINGPNGPTSMGVYYPTHDKTKDVRYAPDDSSWERFADLMRFFGEQHKKPLLPKFVFKISLSYLEHLYLGVNLDAMIIKQEEKGKGFPVVVFSHGLSANIHLYSLQLKEWASNGFIVFSIDHDEEIHLKYDKFASHAEYLKERSGQLDIRKKTVAKVLDLVHDPAYIRNLFNEQPVTLDLNRLFLSGHSFGGGTTAELAAQDKRVTGGLVLLDPWFECCSEDMLLKPINKPVLSLRSTAFNKVPALRDRVVKHAELNDGKKGRAVSGLFKDSMHNANTDLTILMPREMVAMKEIPGISAVESHVICQTSLTQIFLETVLRQEEKGSSESIKSEVVERFKEKLRSLNIENTLEIDE